MPKSLNARLLLAFAFIVILTLSISAVGTLFLLRNQQQDAAEERVGRLAEPIALAVALLERSGVPDNEIQDTINGYAESFDVRILMVDSSGVVVTDTDTRLNGQTVDVFQSPVSIVNRGNAAFRMAEYNVRGDDLMLFAPPRESLHLTVSRLEEIQSLIYELSAADTPPEALQELLGDFISNPNTTLTIPPPRLRPLVAVPAAEIASAWQDLIPQLTIAGGIALVAATAAAFLISRSVTGRLARVTRAAQEMARGEYEQQLDPAGGDEIGRLARAFNEMSRQVSRSDQMMRDLLANVSHELKTPLTSIQGFSQALEEGAISSEDDYQQAGRIINEETGRMRRLVDDLIELSRLESGQAPVRREPVDLSDLLSTCARRFERQLQDTRTELRLDVPKLPRLEADGRRLEQAFSNLIENAVRHAPNGCAITVRAEARNGHVYVAIHNTGSYIREEELPRVFERFFQLDRNRSVSGSGLGLAIVREVVQAHGGHISATSDQQRGTEFTVSLPIKPPPNGRQRRGHS